MGWMARANSMGLRGSPCWTPIEDVRRNSSKNMLLRQPRVCVTHGRIDRQTSLTLVSTACRLTRLKAFDKSTYALFNSFSSGHSKIGARLSTRAQPSHSLPPVSKHYRCQGDCYVTISGCHLRRVVVGVQGRQ